MSADDEVRKIIDELDEEEAQNPLMAQAERSLNELYGAAAGGGGGNEASDEDGAEGASDGAIDPADAVIITEGWANILAGGEEAFSEALLGKWRMLVAVDEKCKQAQRSSTDAEDEDGAKRIASRINLEASAEIDANEDTLARFLGNLIFYTDKLLVGFLDAAVGSLHGFSWRRTPRYDEQDLRAIGEKAPTTTLLSCLRKAW